MDSSNRDDTVERSAEEVAWDEEFSPKKDEDLPMVLGDLAKLAVSIPIALVQVPMSLLPEGTARHGRAALRESFLAVRSLLGALGDGIEGILAEPGSDRPAPSAVRGPQGTWGNARQAGQAAETGGPSSTARARRIEIKDDAAAPPDGDDLPDDRGLHSEINY